MSFAEDRFYVYVDSHRRTSGTDSNFDYTVTFPPGKNYDRVVCLSALIPKSFYLINSTSQTFLLTEGATTVTITIPQGDYILYAFQNVIQNLLNVNSPNGWVYAMTYPTITTSPNTGKWTWTVTGNTSQPSITVTNNNYKQFGFVKDSTNTFVGSTLTSTNVIKLQVDDRILITSNIVAGESFIDGTVLQEINASPSPDFSTIVFQSTASDAYSKPLNYGQNVYSFSLTNEDGDLLDFNGINVNFTLLIYKQDSTFNRVKDFLKIKLLEDTSK